jgi:hypothetical protein
MPGQARGRPITITASAGRTEAHVGRAAHWPRRTWGKPFQSVFAQKKWAREKGAVTARQTALFGAASNGGCDGHCHRNTKKMPKELAFNLRH